MRRGCRSGSSPPSVTWRSGELARLMRDTGRGVDFVNIDGGEGGTGASPLVFSDAVSMPFRLGFSRVYRHSPSRFARAAGVRRCRQARIAR